MEIHNYNVYCFFNLSKRATRRQGENLIRGVCSRIIGKDVLPKMEWKRTKHEGSELRILDGSNYHANITAFIYVTLHVGMQVNTVKFEVV